MEFKKISLHSQKLQAQLNFYGTVLGFDTQVKENSFSLQAGTTELEFLESKDEENHYHFAFLVCEEHFDACRAFVKELGIPLLPNSETGDEITYWENNTGRSIYFLDEDGNIGEFISRPTLGYTSNAEWSIQEVLKVNEIGTPVSDTLGTSQELLEKVGLQVPEHFQQTFHERFCWTGDFNSTLLVVKEGRHWFPTETPAISSDLELEIQEGERSISLSFKEGAFLLK